MQSELTLASLSSQKSRGDGAIRPALPAGTLSACYPPAAAILNGESHRKVKTVRLIRNLPSGSVAFKNGAIAAVPTNRYATGLPFVPDARPTDRPTRALPGRKGMS